MLTSLKNSTNFFTYYAEHYEEYFPEFPSFHVNLLQLILISFIVYFLLKRFVLEKIFIDYEGKWVFVTGCDSGFGRLTSLYLAAKGVNVFAGCYTEKGQEELQRKADCLRMGKLYPIRLDITKDESVDAAYKRIREILSDHNASLWAVINNAGIFSIFGPDAWCGIEEYKMSLDVNTLGAVRICHKFMPLLKHSKGRIVTMGSSAGRIHGLFVGPYVTAKFAVEAYMDCLRLELRQFGVSVHILEPGAFKTDLLSEEAQNKRIDTIWGKLTESVRIEYGETFKENFKQAWHTGVSIVANPHLEWVVENYFHALFSRWPRLRYYTGWDAIFCFIPLSIFPTFLQDTILSGMYALQPGPQLVPEILRVNSKDA
ncbi:unnamed protein product, partial [Mesorhabditis belari]|uniref:Uncharacterized protein n=1 Tax=Mesorhabditis belari TaxID=2138241 RepID=A0AAF3FRA8_9BILA